MSRSSRLHVVYASGEQKLASLHVIFDGAELLTSPEARVAGSLCSLTCSSVGDLAHMYPPGLVLVHHSDDPIGSRHGHPGLCFVILPSSCACQKTARTARHFAPAKAKDSATVIMEILAVVL